VLNETFFNEITIRMPKPAVEVLERLAGQSILGGVPAARLWPGSGLDDLMLVASTEVNTDADRAALVAGLTDALGHG
jgi:glycine dehydrogenase subunit 1